MSKPEQKEKDRKFIVTMSWVFLAAAGMSVSSSLIQFILALFPTPAIDKIIEKIAPGLSTDIVEILPPFLKYTLEHRLIFSTLFLVLSALTLPAAFAFLKRKNWSRILFAWLMALTGLTAFIPALLPSFFLLLLPSSSLYPMESIIFMNHILNYFYLFFAILTGALHGWIICKLLKASIKNEFHRTLGAV